jgi:GNAT superfamily N-acetyltransferase
MDIRQLAPSELPALLALYAQLHPTDAPVPPMAELQAIWQELLNNPRHRTWGVYVDDALVATCNITIIPNLTRGGSPFGLIENVVTDRGYRGHGYGKAVLQAAVAYGWSQGCYKVMLATSRKDPGTTAFYVAAGFDCHDKNAFVIRAPAAV